MLKGIQLSLNVMKTHAMLISTKPRHKTLKNQGESLKLLIRNDEHDVVQKNKVSWGADCKKVGLEGTH